MLGKLLKITECLITFGEVIVPTIVTRMKIKVTKKKVGVHATVEEIFIMETLPTGQGQTL